jgi:hypothetical protein
MAGPTTTRRALGAAVALGLALWIVGSFAGPAIAGSSTQQLSSLVGRSAVLAEAPGRPAAADRSHGSAGWVGISTLAVVALVALAALVALVAASGCDARRRWWARLVGAPPALLSIPVTSR